MWYVEYYSALKRKEILPYATACMNLEDIVLKILRGLISCCLFFVVVVQSFSLVQLFATLWTVAYQASLSFTVSQSLLKLMSIESVITFNNLILFHTPLLLSPVFPSIRVFSSESAIRIRWTKLQHQSFQRIFRTDFL